MTAHSTLVQQISKQFSEQSRARNKPRNGSTKNLDFRSRFITSVSNPSNSIDK